MKTIGYVLADFPVFSETFVGNEIRAMQEQGHRVVPIVLRRTDGPAQSADLKLKEIAHYLPEHSDFSALKALPSLSSSFLSALQFCRQQTGLPVYSLLGNAMKIASIARQEGIEHFHAHFAGPAAAHAIVAARLMRVSCSFVCHGHDVYSEAIDLPEKLEAADFVVAVCNDMAEDLHTLCPEAEISIVPCGIDPTRFRPRLNGGDNGRLLFIGRLVEQKGIDDLFTALHEMGDAMPPVDIVGDGPLKQRLQAQAIKFELEKKGLAFLGPKPAEWLTENGPHYKALVAPFKVAPDKSRDSGPLVAKEAMAMALPVITTDFMGMKETITPECGYKVPPGNPQALQAALEAFLALSPENQEEMGAAGRRRVCETFTLQNQARALSNLVEAAIPHRKAA
ncbi:glycosyltransferase family 4 protein [Pseudovibrio exalbescens]|uniref:glycosyltransferase family 4 protein n=1 Tax=Pseudovibrio exalbescens TaxID=197461 RepID=UPI002365B1B2|nr:glycosyltransferase family 4 protein [Pseudovibrio exalbescens]MDD7909215.1 glycosyltransferase family 4 protein [Pseudovibrio exalbescens]